MLIKDAENLERFAAVDTLIVDKTGTLTRRPARGYGPDRVWQTDTDENVLEARRRAGTWQRAPTCRSDRGRRAGAGTSLCPKLQEFEAVTGKGVKGKCLAARTVALGNAAMMEDELGLKVRVRIWRRPMRLRG